MAVGSTVVADTRFLIALAIPPEREQKEKVTRLLREALREGLVIPAIVLAEFMRIVVPRLGLESCTTQINVLKMSGARIMAIDEGIAVSAGQMLVRHPKVPMADALISSTHFAVKAKAVLTDDPHFGKLGIRTRWI